MGNTIRREVGFQVEDNTMAANSDEIIDKILKMKTKIKSSTPKEIEPDLNDIDINAKSVSKVRAKPPPRNPEPDNNKGEQQFKRKRLQLADFSQPDKSNRISIRDSQNVDRDNLNLMI